MLDSSSMTRMFAEPGFPLEPDAEMGAFKGNATSDMYGVPQQGKFEMEGCARAD
jgi:hypothetical protein